MNNKKQIKIVKSYPVSYAQYGLWMLMQKNGKHPIFIDFDIILHSPINIDIIHKTINAVIEKHEILRSDIKIINGEPQNVIYNIVPLNYIFQNGNSNLNTLLSEDNSNIINFNPKVKIEIELKKTKCVLYIQCDHTVFDSWSRNLLYNEILYYYNLLSNKKHILPSSSQKISYQDYVNWQTIFLSSKKGIKNEKYWENKLAIEMPQTNIPPDITNLPHLPTEQFCLTKKISRNVFVKLKTACFKSKTTLFGFLLSAFLVFLYRISNSTKLVIGIPFSTRQNIDKNFSSCIGIFVNILPFIIEINKDITFDKFNKLIYDKLKELYKYRHYPYEKILELVKKIERPSNNSIFDIVFNKLPNTNINNSLNDNAIDGTHTETNFSLGNFSVDIQESKNDLIFYFNYNNKKYKLNTVKMLARRYFRLLNSLVENNNEISLSRVNILSSYEYRKIVYDWNKTQAPYPKDKTIHQLFEEQVEKTPDNIAVVFEDKQLTYKELNEKSNQLARYIRKQYKDWTEQELRPDTLIALCLDRSREMIIAILAVLKAGGAYVPIDPAYPNDRINYLLEDTATDIVLTQKHLKQQLEKIRKGIKIIAINDKKVQEELGTLSIRNLKRKNQSTNLAYVIYTSGSTGQPKGVMIGHEALVCRTFWMISQYPLCLHDNVLFKTTYIFDVSVVEWSWPLLSGSNLVVFPQKQVEDIAYINQFSIEHKISVFQLVPSFLSAILHSNKTDFLSQLKYCLVAGEILPKNMCNDYLSVVRKKNLWNIYGPTEATVYTTSFLYDNDSHMQIPIGKPISNTKVYILNTNLTLVPIGVVGELYIGGAGLAQGYLNQPELTAERFIPNPFATEEDKSKGYTRLYKTGDLVRWLPDGNIEYIGRDDFQVKIRGFRIELGEIESAISKFKGIKQVSVQAKDKQTEIGTNKYLVAYYTVESIKNKPKVVDKEDIRVYLSKTLPDYMVPSAFVELKNFPLTANGKLDRKALPDPKFTDKDSYVAPRNELEQQLCTIWQEILGLKKVGITDNFFKIGGDSILTIKMLSKIRRNLKTNISLAQLFQNSTIKDISNIINNNEVKFQDDTPKLVLYDLEKAKEDIKKFVPLNISNNMIYPEGVLLTGATGFLGSYLLTSLLKNTKADIYCLIRGENLKEIKGKLKNSLNNCNNLTIIKNSRIKLVRGDIGEKYLGLSLKDFNIINNNIDSIYHNAANVHHLYDYKMLRTANVSSTLELLKLFYNKKRPKVFHYISTNSAAMENPTDLFKKKEMEEYEFSSSSGYSLTKWVSENILLDAFKQGIPITIYRPGNITGDSVTGYSNYQQNHFLLVLKGCIQIGVAPDIDFLIEMTPVDILAEAIIKLSLQYNSKGKTYNLENPTKLPFKKYVRELQEYGFNIDIIPAEKWRRKYVSKIDEKNAMYPLREFYLNEITHVDSFVEDKMFLEAQNQLNIIGVKYPNNYKKLIRIYLDFLTKNGFLNM